MSDYEVTNGAPDGPTHEMFGLTYANYAVFSRALLQSMPLYWQEAFKELIDDYWAHWEGCDLEPDGYWVRARSWDGKFVSDPAPHYNRGRTLVRPKVPRV